MPGAGDDLQPRVRQLFGERAGQGQVRSVALSARDDHRDRDPLGVDDAACRLPHQPRELGRAERGDLLGGACAVRLRELGDELAVQEAARHDSGGQRERACAPPQTGRQTVEAGADDQPADSDALSHVQSNETAQREPADISAGRDEPGDLVDCGLEASAVRRDEVRRERVREDVELGLPRAGAGPDPVQEEERQETDSDSVIQMLPSPHWTSRASPPGSVRLVRRSFTRCPASSAIGPSTGPAPNMCRQARTWL